MKNLVLVSVVILAATTASAMAESTHSNTSVGAPRDEVIHKTTVGDQKTATYADKPVTVQHAATVDPYTGTSDRKNFAGKTSIAPHQVATDKAKH
jgi:hypothetical protein